MSTTRLAANISNFRQWRRCNNRRRGLSSQSKLTQSLSVAVSFTVGEFWESIFSVSRLSAAWVVLLSTINKQILTSLKIKIRMYF